jgi:predicted nucleotidyltransferase
MNNNEIQRIFKFASSELAKNGIRSIVIGGFAVNYHGYTRGTLDLDFMIQQGDEEKLKKLMLAEGYTDFAIHDNVIFFQRPGTSLRIDFLRVDDKTLEHFLSRAKKVEIDGIKLLLASLRDIIAMKLFAVEYGSPSRKEKDIEDIVQLAIVNSLATNELKSLCDQYASKKVYEQICKRIETQKEF